MILNTQRRWRRPIDDRVQRNVMNVWRRVPGKGQQAGLDVAHSLPGVACHVTINDLERGCVQRIEGNWRRDWSVGGAMRNQNCRQRLNIGIGISYAQALTKRHNNTPTDVAMTLRDVYHKMQHGTYRCNGKAMPIGGDVTKLMLCDQLSPEHESDSARYSCAPPTFLARKNVGGKSIAW